MDVRASSHYRIARFGVRVPSQRVLPHDRQPDRLSQQHKKQGMFCLELSYHPILYQHYLLIQEFCY